MRRALLLVLAAVPPACSRGDDGGQELVRELRAIRGTLERMQGAAQTTPPDGAPDGAALRQALEPLREGVQTLLGEQEALRARQDALAGEMSRWAELVAPALRQDQAEDLRALQQRLQELERELRDQATRHEEVRDLLLRAMDSTSERLDAFLRTLGEIRPSGTAPGSETPPSQPDRGKEAAPGGAPPEPAPADRPDGRGAARAGAEQWTPWVLLAGGTLAILFLWRLWREPVAPPLAQPAVEQDMQDWWVVVDELAQAMAAQNELHALGGDPGGPAADDAQPDAREGRGDGHAHADGAVAPKTGEDPAAAPQPPPSLESCEGAAAPGPARGQAAPAALEWDEPCADPPAAAGRLRAWLLREPRVLLRPAPVLETGAAHLRLRLWVMGDLPDGERRQLWTAARQVLRTDGPRRP